MLAIAGAILSNPKVLLVDEMSLGLAPNVVAQLLETVQLLARQRLMGVLVVEQHVHACLSIADRGYVMSHGRVVSEGTAHELVEKIDLLHAAYLGGLNAVPL
jgi:branched-chain amino acid transport system ATP-binding protein